MTRVDPRYIQAFIAAEAAARKWRREHPSAAVAFHPLQLGPPPAAGRGGVIGGVDQALALGVASDAAARELLLAIDAAVEGGATIMMAEYALERVFGLKQALARFDEN